MNKVLSTAENEVVRREILELCQAAAPYGAGLPVLKASLRKTGYELAEKELRCQADYLEGKGLIRRQEVKNWSLHIDRCILFITPEGVDYLEGNGPDIAGVD